MTGAEILLGVGMAVAAGGAVYGGVAAHQSAQYNAALAEQQAQLERQRGKIAQKQIQRQAEQTKARQRALYGASGVTLEGSPLIAIADTAIEFEKDIAIAAWDSQIAQSRAHARAGEHRMMGTQALVSSGFEAGESLLTGASKGADKHGWFSGSGSEG